MQKLLITFTFITWIACGLFAQDPSAIVEYESTTQGLLIPRMSTSERNAIPVPAQGLLVYDASLSGFYFYNGSSWQPVSSGGSGGPDTDQQTLFVNGNVLTLSAGASGGGGSVSLTPYLDNTDGQALSFSPDNGLLTISGGNSVDLSSLSGGGGGSSASMIADADNDTKIQTEESTEEDIIRFDLGGFEAAVLDRVGSNVPRLQLINPNGDNTVVGMEAFDSNVQSGDNSAFGAYALHANEDGSYNSAFGKNALYNNIDGNYNSAFGAYSLDSNETGSYNAAFGYYSLKLNREGAYNSGFGAYALGNNSIGYENSAFGHYALKANENGELNSAFGADALSGNIDGFENSAFGAYALSNNMSGEQNTAIGVDALSINSSGNGNTAVGYFALSENTTGDNNTAVGYEALSAGSNISNVSNSTALGHFAQCVASNQVRVGNSSILSIGGHKSWTTISDGRFKNEVTSSNVPGLQFINLLRPVTYKMDVHAQEDWWAENYGIRDSSNHAGRYHAERVLSTGFIAQEVEAAAQSIGYDFSGVDAPKNEKDYYGLRYATFVVPLVKATQELNTQLTESRGQIVDLKAALESEQRRNASLENRLQRLEKIVEGL